MIDDEDGDTYRAVYTVRFEGMIYVLRAFQKKSKKGSETPKRNIEVIKDRLKVAEAHTANTMGKAPTNDQRKKSDRRQRQRFR